MTNEIIIEPINANSSVEYNQRSIVLHDNARLIVINDQVSLERASALRAAIKDMAKEIESERKRITVPLDNAKKAVMDLFRPATNWLETAEGILNVSIVKYANDQEKMRREQEEKLRKEAAAKEAKRRAELEERARKARESGKDDKADVLEQKAAEVHFEAPVVASTLQKVEGLSFREDWSAEVVDLMALVKAVADGQAPLAFLEANIKVLNSQAKATKNSLVFPGVKFISKRVPIGRQVW
jgi:hypothetical protein